MENSYRDLYDLGLSLQKEVSAPYTTKEWFAASGDCISRIESLLGQWARFYQVEETLSQCMALACELTGSEQYNECEREYILALQKPATSHPSRSWFNHGKRRRLVTEKANAEERDLSKRVKPLRESQIVIDPEQEIVPKADVSTYQQYQRKTQQMLDQMHGWRPVNTPPDEIITMGEANGWSEGPAGFYRKTQPGNETPGQVQDLPSQDKNTPSSINKPPEEDQMDTFSAEGKSGKDNDKIYTEQQSRSVSHKRSEGEEFPVDFTRNELSEKPGSPITRPGKKKRLTVPPSVEKTASGHDTLNMDSKSQKIHSKFKGLRDFAQTIVETGFIGEETAGISRSRRNQSTGEEESTDHGRYPDFEWRENAPGNEPDARTLFPISMDHQPSTSHLMKYNENDQSAVKQIIDYLADNNYGSTQWSELSLYDTPDIDEIWETLTNRLRQDYKRHYGD